MEKDRGDSQEPVPRRQRRKAAPSGQQTAGRRALEEVVSLQANAGGAGGVKEKKVNVGPVLRAVQMASAELSPEEVESLQDPQFRSQAAKWRSGSGSRRVSAVLAKLLNGLHAIKPGWVSAGLETEDMPVVEALPLKEKVENGQLAIRMKRWGILAMVWLRRHWVTAWCLALLLFFPKLIAAVVAMTIRLMMRLLMALIMRVFREVAVELGGVLTQLSSLTSGLEQALVHYLDSMMVELLPTSLLVFPGPGVEQGPGDEMLSRSGQSAGLGG